MVTITKPVSREEIKEAFTLIYDEIGNYNKTLIKQWQAMTIEKRFTSEGRELGNYIDDLNRVVRAVELFLINAKKQEKKYDNCSS